MRWDLEDGSRELTPPAFDVGGQAHGYGGGAYAVTPVGVWCVSAADGLIYRFGPGEPSRVTHPRAGSAGYGDLVAVSDGVLAVREDADGDALVTVGVNGAERILVRTDGFFAAPTPGAGRLAWLRWRPDRMPWDGCELWTGAWLPGGPVDDRRRVAGGDEESVSQPQWAPDGRLYFVSDRSGWWNLYCWDGEAVVPVAPMSAECAAAPWELGYRSYAFLPGGRIVMVAQEGPRHRLLVAGPDRRCMSVALPYTSMKPYVATVGAAVGVVASSPIATPEIVLVNVNDPVDIRVLARSAAPIVDSA